MKFVFLTKSVALGIFFSNSVLLLKLTGNGAKLSISSLSTLLFRLAKFAFSAKLEVSTSLAF